VKNLSTATIAALLALAAPAAPARAADDAVIQEVLGILKERGIVDEAKYGELVEKNKAYETKQSSLLSKIIWTGDFRGRYENYWFDRDPLGNDTDNRTRLRYRLRIGAIVPVNDWLTAGFKLASGESENRSTNRTLGVGDDFDRDTIAIDEAYLQVRLPIDVGSSTFVFGRQNNPFVWKNGKDYMVWDNDYNLEGVSLRWTGQPTSRVSLFANGGYFLIDENSTAKDPHFFAVQAGGQLQAAEKLALGGRATWFQYGSLNAAFFTRQNAFGNVGLSDNVDGAITQVEVSAFARATYSSAWPVLLHAHFSKNLDAASLPGAGRQDTGWGLALEVGDAKQIALLGVGYYRLQADFAPALYTDSDLFDGFTNREGWNLYAARQILPNTEISLSLFLSDAIEESAGFATSVANSDRIRLQTDLTLKF
jgi:hypothetical protein